MVESAPHDPGGGRRPHLEEKPDAKAVPPIFSRGARFLYVPVEQSALTDSRYDILARLAGWANRHEALGRMIRLWSDCQGRNTYHLTGAELEALVGCSPDHLVSARLALRIGSKAQLYYVRGTKDRIEAVEKRRKSNRDRQKRYRERKAASNASQDATSRVSHAWPLRVSHASTPPSPPPPLDPSPSPTPSPPDLVSPSPSPSQTRETPTTTRLPESSDSGVLVLTPSNGGRPRKVPVIAPKPKPGAMVQPEKLQQIEADFGKLYEYYPRHDGKDEAWRAFVKLDPDLATLKLIAADIRQRLSDGEWERTPDGRKHIPYLSTYLNNRRWVRE